MDLGLNKIAVAEATGYKKVEYPSCHQLELKR